MHLYSKKLQVVQLGMMGKLETTANKNEKITRNQGEEARVALLTISSNSPLGSVVLPVPETLRFSGLEALVPGINGIASII